MKRLKKYFKHMIVGVLACITLVQTCLSPVYADSNDLRKTYIAMKHEASLSSLDKESIDTQTLRIIALYLSNYYMPFSTVLDGTDVSSTDEDEDEEEGSSSSSSSKNENTKQLMIKALKDAGFEEETAKVLVGYTLQASLSSAKPLTYHATKTEMLKYAKSNAASDDTLSLGIVSGMLMSGANNVTSGGPNSRKTTYNPAPFVKKGTTKEDYMYVNDGKILERLQTLPDGTTLSGDTYRLTYASFLSMLAYGIEKDFKYYSDGAESSDTVFSSSKHVRAAYGFVNDTLKYGDGIGGSFSNVTRNQVENLQSDEEYFDVTAMGAQLYVDWVGNIIMDTGVERVVILPACTNPYTFKIVGGNNGGRMNLISSFGIQEVINGSVTRVNDEQGSFDEKYHESRYQFFTSADTGTLFNNLRWTTFRGESDTKFDAVAGNGWGKNNIILTMYARGMGLADENYVTETGDTSYSGATDTFKAFNEGNDIKTEGSWDYPDFPCLKNYAVDVPDGVEAPDNVKMIKTVDEGVLAFTTVVKYDDVNEFDGEDKDWEGHVLTPNIMEGTGNTKTGGAKSAFSTVGAFKNVGVSTGEMVTSLDASVSDCIYTTYVYAYSNYLDKAAESGQTFDKDKHKVDMVFNGDVFPTAMDNDIDWDAIAEDLGDDDGLQTEIMSMVYYILHPAEGMHYFSVWAKNKISAFLLGWHEDMVGATSSNTSTGMTKYIGFTGYTTLPALEDMSWTNWLLVNYNSIIVYLIIIIAVILCCYVIVGSLTAQRALLGMFMFALLAFLPPVAINAAVGVVNQTCDAIYGTKFTYWALVQHQSYLQDLYSATSGSAEQYKQFVLTGEYAAPDGKTPAETAEEQTDNNFASVKLKWMSPKKDNYMATFVQETEEDVGNAESAGQTFLNNMLMIGGKSYSGEDYLNSPEALYLYRDYMNITTYSLKSYNLYSNYNGGGVVSTSDGDYKLQVGYQWNKAGTNLKKIKYSSGVPFNYMVYVNYEKDAKYNSLYNKDYHDLSSVQAIRRGFLNNTLEKTVDINTSRVDYYAEGSYAVNYLLNFPKAYNDIFNGYTMLQEDLKNGSVSIDKSKLWGYGLPQSYFNFTQSDLSATTSDTTTSTSTGYSKDLLDYFYYSLYSESPYYYMTYNILDQMKAFSGYTYSMSKSGSVSVGEDGNFKDMFLGDNLDYFFNYSENAGDGYGELKDFMNMHDLFYYVIPLMDTGNQLVDLFDETYGMELYDDIKVRFTKDGYVAVGKNGETDIITDIVGPSGEYIDMGGKTGQTYAEVSKDWTEEEVYKFWHNYNVTIIFNAYSTWVDTMYDCNYAKPTIIKIGGKEKRVENPLDPTCYYYSVVTDEHGNQSIVADGRPMVFSRSEMGYYGLEWNDLTKVEQKIINVQENVYEKAIDLMNYYNFDDDVLVSSYAMLQLFEFNKEFSQNNVIGQSYVMYPQSYELKAFTYDAYLRLIIANTTGDDLQAEQGQSLYERTMENSSITFGILLIILDVICVYLIPAFKVFFLVALFFMSIMLIVASAVKIELNILQVVWKSLLFPLVSFSAVSIGLAFIVSLFMSNGAKGVTGELTPTIQLGDPTMVIAVMIVINAVALYLYFKICKQAAKDFMKYTKAILNNIGGTVVGALKTVGAVAMAGGIVSALRNRGDGSGGGSGSHDPKQSGKDNMPRPHATGDTASGSGGGAGGSDGSGAGAKSDSGYSAEKAHGQVAQASKPESEKPTGDSTNKYEKRAKEGKNKREGGSVSGSVKPEIGDAKKPTSSEKAKTYAQRARDQKAYSDSVGSDANAGEKLAGVRSRVASKVNYAKSKGYEMHDKAGKTIDSAKKGATERINTAKSGASSAMKNASSRVKNSNAARQYNRVKESAKTNMKSYKSGVNKANRRTQSAINSYKKPKKGSRKSKK